MQLTNFSDRMSRHNLVRERKQTQDLIQFRYWVQAESQMLNMAIFQQITTTADSQVFSLSIVLFCWRLIDFFVCRTKAVLLNYGPMLSDVVGMEGGSLSSGWWIRGIVMIENERQCGGGVKVIITELE